MRHSGYIRRVLYTSMIKANSCEVVLIMHIPTFSFRINTDFNINNVSLTNSMHNALLNNTGPFISIHNHPNNSFFSVKDLLTFLSYVNMQSCIVVGNSGKIIHIMTKRNKKKTSSFIYAIVEKLIRILIKNNLIKEHSSAKIYLDILKDFGIQYKTYYEEG